MKDFFNGIMRAISSLIGLAMVLMGGIWILQGFNIAFLDSFMANDKQWALWGAILPRWARASSTGATRGCGEAGVGDEVKSVFICTLARGHATGCPHRVQKPPSYTNKSVKRPGRRVRGLVSRAAACFPEKAGA